MPLSDISLECFKPMLEVLLESCVGDKICDSSSYGAAARPSSSPPFPAHSSAVFAVLELCVDLASLELTCLSS